MYRVAVFTSPTCRACPKAKEMAKRASQELGVGYTEYDAFEAYERSYEASITTVPTTVLYLRNTPVATVPGVIPTAKLVGLFRSAMR